MVQVNKKYIIEEFDAWIKETRKSMAEILEFNTNNFQLIYELKRQINELHDEIDLLKRTIYMQKFNRK